ncbi:MAG: Porphobilinogen deaminase HemC [Candidatus Methanohalarchaeum thermophilum]|uniref:Hydroxymethylbilane synthase n=1 Tax=Methanohalarchaeum thermophilum TaxID=1903181 RepID=A0A1Q6DXN0_METT1|nr:MAG: Porphobilinogen deaminase HemC [Candidatus Methanohalarchaeum thermophilum]
MKTYKVGTRKSKLALSQTQIAIDLLEKETEYDFEIRTLDTIGDKENWKSIEEIEGDGVFTRELDEALINEAIDIAVHSAKDVPTNLRKEISIGAFTERKYPSDVIIGNKFNELKDGALIGTGSPRRQEQIKRKRPDLKVTKVRGNVETRISKIGKEVDAVVLAEAGIQRLGIEKKISEKLPINDFLPAPGQGSLCITYRKGENKIKKLLNKVDHNKTSKAVKAERAAMNEFGLGCTVPVGAHAHIKNNKLYIKLEHVEKRKKVTLSGKANKAEEIGRKAAKKIIGEKK